MYITHQKEQFSVAFLRAVAAVAGYSVTRCDVDNDSVDLTFCGTRKEGTTRRAPKLDLQAKCTETDDGQGEALKFQLPMKNYNDLRTPDVHVPTILVVLCVPADVAQWIEQRQDEMLLRRCAYWKSLRNEPEVSNLKTRQVEIPRTQQFSVAELRAIMSRIGEGSLP